MSRKEYHSVQEAVDDFNESKREFIEAVDESLRESRLVKIMNKIVNWWIRSRRSRDEAVREKKDW